MNDKIDDTAIKSILTVMDDTLVPSTLNEERRKIMKSRILDQLNPSIHGSQTVRHSDGLWHNILPGVSKKLLHRYENTNRETYLLKMAPGARIPEHEHIQDEECLLIEGNVFFGELELKKGDYHIIYANHPHPAATSPKGALLMIQAAAPY